MRMRIITREPDGAIYDIWEVEYRLLKNGRLPKFHQDLIIERLEMAGRGEIKSTIELEILT